MVPTASFELKNEAFALGCKGMRQFWKAEDEVVVVEAATVVIDVAVLVSVVVLTKLFDEADCTVRRRRTARAAPTPIEMPAS